MSRTKTILGSSALVAALALGGWGAKTYFTPAFTGGAGFTTAKAYAPARDQNINFHLWYPAQAGGRTKTVGGNGVFHGTTAGRNSTPADGTYPLIVISHGGGGNAGQLGWIAQALANKGFVVALPNHPGSTSHDSSAREVVKVWKRPPDLTAVIDEITGDPATFPFIDADRIATLGFSYGGYTAFALSGAIVDPDRLTRFCDDDQTGMSDCTFLTRAGVDLHQIDLTAADTPHRDPRIAAAAIIDPGIISAITDNSLAAIDIPMLIINLGKAGNIPQGVDAGHAATLVPQADYRFVEGANHFSFLAQCKPRGAKILSDEGEIDPLCDPTVRPRADIHAELTDMITAYFAQVL